MNNERYSIFFKAMMTGLLGGIILILGASAVCIPFLFRSRRFVDAVI